MLFTYADDFVVVMTGENEHAQALREEVAAVLAPMGLPQRRSGSPLIVDTCRSCNITSDGSNGHLGIGAAAIGERVLTGLKTNAGIR